jgi:hypothetical protein
MADSNYKWILQKKDSLSRYIWVDALEDKTTGRVC